MMYIKYQKIYFSAAKYAIHCLMKGDRDVCIYFIISSHMADEYFIKLVAFLARESERKMTQERQK